MMRAKLSKYFYLDELLRSQTAVRHNIDMAPSDEVLTNLRRFALGVLDPIREELGRPVFVSSGYRPPELNRLIGGSVSSDHQWGLAADVAGTGVTPYELAAIMRHVFNRDRIHIKQVILEFGNWVHVSTPEVLRHPPAEFLTAYREGGETIYANGFLDIDPLTRGLRNA